MCMHVCILGVESVRGEGGGGIPKAGIPHSMPL